MLTNDEIKTALHAARVLPLRIPNPHGPFGLEQVAEAVAQLHDADVNVLSRPVALRTQTWEKLDEFARKAASTADQPLTASDVAAALLEQVIARGIA